MPPDSAPSLSFGLIERACLQCVTEGLTPASPGKEQGLIAVKVLVSSHSLALTLH